MKSRVSRIFLMIAGIITVIVILFSQSFYQPTDKAVAKVKKDHKTEKQLSIAPSDVVPTSEVQVDKSAAAIIEIVLPEEADTHSYLPDTKAFVSFFTILLRATISPNAP